MQPRRLNQKDRTEKNKPRRQSQGGDRAEKTRHSTAKKTQPRKRHSREDSGDEGRKLVPLLRKAREHKATIDKTAQGKTSDSTSGSTTNILLMKSLASLDIEKG